MEEQTSLYESRRRDYQTARALGKLRDAEAALTDMISARPCEEALPQLTAWLGECREQIQREASPFWRMAALFGFRKAVRS